MTLPRPARALACSLAACVLAYVPADAQMATADRLEAAGWWPTKGRPPRADYVGPATCARCHTTQSATQPTTAMARTARRAADSEVLGEHPSLEFVVGAYSYRITTDNGRSVYSVSDAKRTVSAELGWSFGVGKVGQTYLFERNGQMHEARVSYFDAVRALDFTPARALRSPRDVEEAIGRLIPDREVHRCFGCHTTASTTEGRMNVAGLTTGVTCEACHGPGRAHVAAMEQRQVAEGRAAILNPRTLDPAASVDFCGACHATYWDVKLSGEKGISALRSQPFRLQSSKCWSASDRRITCVACHDPHQPLSRDAKAYDARCLSCHAQPGARPTAEHPGPACTTKNENCVTCHMRKYDVPEMHFSFTDHLIR